MRGINQVTLEGNLGADPTVRTTKAGAAWCTFSVATSRNRKEGEGFVEETQWHEVKAFGGEADKAIAGLRRGASVRVQGRLDYEKWMDEHGQNRKTTRIVCEQLTVLPRTRLDLPVEMEAVA